MILHRILRSDIDHDRISMREFLNKKFDLSDEEVQNLYSDYLETLPEDKRDDEDF